MMLIFNTQNQKKKHTESILIMALGVGENDIEICIFLIKKVKERNYAIFLYRLTFLISSFIIFLYEARM